MSPDYSKSTFPSSFVVRVVLRSVSSHTFNFEVMLAYELVYVIVMVEFIIF